MNRSLFAGSVAACLCLAAGGGRLMAADVTTAPAPADPAPIAGDASASVPAKVCLGDLQAFDSQMEKDGYWLSGSGYGFGYPVGAGYGYGDSTDLASSSMATAADFQAARPGYEVRMLLATANILARHGQQQACEDVLATTRDIYKVYAADMGQAGTPKADIPGWRKHQIESARLVSEDNVSYRSDELLGTDVRNQQDEILGTVDDIVTNPHSGRIAYLVIARGGLFGIGEEYVAVPWSDFRATPDMSLLVLETTKVDMDAAPQSKDEKFAAAANFDAQSQKVDAYWREHLPD